MATLNSNGENKVTDPKPVNTFRKVETAETKRVETTDQKSWLLPAALALGLLLIVGGLLTLVRGLQKEDETVADLPEYSPAYVSPSSASSTTPSSESSSPSPTVSQSETARQTPTPAVTSPAPQIATNLRPVPQVKGRDVVRSPKVKSTTRPQPRTMVSPVATVHAEVLPVYQPIVDLPAYSPQYSQQTTSPTPNPTPTAQQTVTVTLSVPGRAYSVAVPAGSTVLTVLEEARKNLGLSYSTEDFGSLGKKITELNGLREGNGQYWFYKVNGSYASKGVSSQTVNQGDLIEWELKSS